MSKYFNKTMKNHSIRRNCGAVKFIQRNAFGEYTFGASVCGESSEYRFRILMYLKLPSA